MISARKLIRDAFAHYIKSAETILEDRVFTDRLIVNHTEDPLAQALITTPREAITVHEESPRKYMRKLQLQIQVAVPRPSKAVNVADLASELSDQIERTLNTALECGLPGTPDSLELKGNETLLEEVKEELDELESSRPLMIVTHDWVITYYAVAEADDSDLSKLSSVHVSAELEESVEKQAKVELCI